MTVRDTVASPPPLLDRFVAVLDHVSDRRLFVFCVLWVVTLGLALQLVFLPYVASFAHWGHGIIANLDSVGFHQMAEQSAARMRSEGLRDFGRWIDGTYNYPVAITALLYLVYPEPWMQLPLNGALFGIVAVTVGRVLTLVAGSRGIGLAGLLPFFLFPSFVLIWGQPHRDLISGTGFSLVLYALVMSAFPPKKAPNLFLVVTLAIAGMAIMWLSRPYALSLSAAGALVFCILALIAKAPPLRVVAVAAAVAICAVANIRGWTETRARIDAGILIAARQQADGQDSPTARESGSAAPAPRAADGGRGDRSAGRFRRTSPPGASQGGSAVTAPDGSVVLAPAETRTPAWLGLPWPRTRRVVRAMESQLTNCLPLPSGGVPDTFMYNMCNVREGFISDALRAGASSGIDYDVRLRSVEDFIAYGPRALAIGLLAPGPDRWGTERTLLGRLATAFVPLEMITAYVAFLVALIVGGRALARPSVLGVLAFCVIYIAIYTVATPQLGGLYRMRAFAFATVVSLALTVTLTRVSRRAPSTSTS